MSIKTLLEKLTDKWIVKSVCIVAACFCYIFNQYSSLEQRPLSIPLNVSQEGEMICRTHIPSSVTVVVRTSSEHIAQVSASGISAKLDLNYYTNEGTFDAPVYVDLPSTIKDLDPLQVTVVPEKIRVKLEKNISKFVKVQARTAGECAYGFEVTGLECSPQYVEVFGPRSIVESISSFQTREVVIDGKNSGFSQQAEVINLDRLVKINGVSSVDVNVKVDYVRDTKEFKQIPVVLRDLNPAFTAAENFTADITLSGTLLDLEEYEPLPDALYADMGAITQEGEYELPVAVLIPTALHLENLSAEKIKVTVRERPPVTEEEQKAGAE